MRDREKYRERETESSGMTVHVTDWYAVKGVGNYENITVPPPMWLSHHCGPFMCRRLWLSYSLDYEGWPAQLNQFELAGKNDGMWDCGREFEKELSKGVKVHLDGRN